MNKRLSTATYIGVVNLILIKEHELGKVILQGNIIQKGN